MKTMKDAVDFIKELPGIEVIRGGFQWRNPGNKFTIKFVIHYTIPSTIIVLDNRIIFDGQVVWIGSFIPENFHQRMRRLQRKSLPEISEKQCRKTSTYNFSRGVDFEACPSGHHNPTFGVLDPGGLLWILPIAASSCTMKTRLHANVLTIAILLVNAILPH